VELQVLATRLYLRVLRTGLQEGVDLSRTPVLGVSLYQVQDLLNAHLCAFAAVLTAALEAVYLGLEGPLLYLLGRLDDLCQACGLLSWSQQLDVLQVEGGDD